MSIRTQRGLLGLLVIAALLAGGLILKVAQSSPLTAATTATGGAPPPPAAAASAPAKINYMGKFGLAPTEAPIGSDVVASASGLPAGVDVTLVWQAFRGAWHLDAKDPANFKGRAYQEDLLPLATARTDAQGAFTTTFKVPDGFGFAHDVRVLEGSTVLNQASFKVKMEVSVSPTNGPVGTPIAIDIRGIGVTPLVSSWVLTYDNGYTGWLSAVTTAGHAHAVIPATGMPGAHVLKVLHGSFTFPYLNMQQSPDPTRPTFSFLFTVTPGPPLLPSAAGDQAIVATAPGQPTTAGAARAWLDVAEATVGTTTNLHATGLAANEDFAVTWLTQVGVDTGMINGSGQARPDAEWGLGTARTDAGGALLLPVTVPQDKGGSHAILIRNASGVAATASLRVRPTALALSPARGPVGTDILVELRGVDDTDTGKIFMLTYDNAYLGYACSVTAQGAITIHLPAAGAPGWHFITLYPGIYKGSDIEGVQNFRIPQLTYAADHPGEALPAFQFAFEVTG